MRSRRPQPAVNYENLRIRVYVDGEDKASIDMELFLGHGIGYKDEFGPWGTKRIGKTGLSIREGLPL